MIIATTEYDMMKNEIDTFTHVIVGVVEAKDVPIKVRAKAILMAEDLFHKVIMNKILEKCVEKSIPCNN